MFVGDVRSASTGSGSSWKLSGASQCVSSVTNFSKYVQCSFAYGALAARSPAESARPPAAGHRLSQRAIARRSATQRASGSTASELRDRPASG